MKRMFVTALAVALLAGIVSLPSGCASTGGPYFERSRENKPHVFRNRVYNPNDARYASAEK